MRAYDHGQHAHHGHGAGHAGHSHGRVHGRAVEERNVAHGTITSITGAGFVLATKEDELTVTIDAGTTYHTPGVATAAKQAGYDGYADLTYAALKVGQGVAVMGERQDDATLLARRVHIPKP